jgi:hypothetical protein
VSKLQRVKYIKIGSKTMELNEVQNYLNSFYFARRINREGK